MDVCPNPFGASGLCKLEESWISSAESNAIGGDLSIIIVWDRELNLTYTDSSGFTLLDGLGDPVAIDGIDAPSETESTFLHYEYGSWAGPYTLSYIPPENPLLRWRSAAGDFMPAFTQTGILESV